MNHETKINYFRIAAGVCSFGFTHEQLDKLVSLYELILEKKGDAALDDMALIEVQVEQRASVKRKKELLDTASKRRGAK